jgi:hypothetical protein
VAFAAATTVFCLITASYLLIVNRNRVVRPTPLMSLAFCGIWQNLTGVLVEPQKTFCACG